MSFMVTSFFLLLWPCYGERPLPAWRRLDVIYVVYAYFVGCRIFHVLA